VAGSAAAQHPPFSVPARAKGTPYQGAPVEASATPHEFLRSPLLPIKPPHQPPCLDPCSRAPALRSLLTPRLCLSLPSRRVALCTSTTPPNSTFPRPSSPLLLLLLLPTPLPPLPLLPAASRLALCALRRCAARCLPQLSIAHPRSSDTYPSPKSTSPCSESSRCCRSTVLLAPSPPEAQTTTIIITTAVAANSPRRVAHRSEDNGQG
jgi:hypothetical protein